MDTFRLLIDLEVLVSISTQQHASDSGATPAMCTLFGTTSERDLHFVRYTDHHLDINTTYIVKKRAFTHYFLDSLERFCGIKPKNVYVFSNAVRSVVDATLKGCGLAACFPFDNVLTRESFGRGNSAQKKSLAAVGLSDDDATCTCSLIVDRSGASWCEDDQGNVITFPRYNFFSTNNNTSNNANNNTVLVRWEAALLDLLIMLRRATFKYGGSGTSSRCSTFSPLPSVLDTIKSSAFRRGGATAIELCVDDQKTTTTIHSDLARALRRAGARVFTSAPSRELSTKSVQLTGADRILWAHRSLRCGMPLPVSIFPADSKEVTNSTIQDLIAFLVLVTTRATDTSSSAPSLHRLREAAHKVLTDHNLYLTDAAAREWFRYLAEDDEEIFKPENGLKQESSPHAATTPAAADPSSAHRPRPTTKRARELEENMKNEAAVKRMLRERYKIKTDDPGALACFADAERRDGNHEAATDILAAAAVLRCFHEGEGCKVIVLAPPIDYSLPNDVAQYVVGGDEIFYDMREE
eukprot:PhM_4_TR18446/c0_g1_i1/m.72850